MLGTRKETEEAVGWLATRPTWNPGNYPILVPKTGWRAISDSQLVADSHSQPHVSAEFEWKLKAGNAAMYLLCLYMYPAG